MPRFFVSPESVSGDTISVSEGDYNHIRNVLRMRVGDSLTVCDGQGWDYACAIEDFDNGVCHLHINERIPSAVELPVEITLYQGFPKKEQRKTERFRAIAESAAKQCGRGILPEVTEPMRFAEAVGDAKARGCCILLPYENAIGMKATKEAFDEAMKVRRIAVFIGPEGGFARDEVELAEKAGARTISLGRRILRTETAGLAVLSALMLRAEEIMENL